MNEGSAIARHQPPIEKRRAGEGSGNTDIGLHKHNEPTSSLSRLKIQLGYLHKCGVNGKGGGGPGERREIIGRAKPLYKQSAEGERSLKLVNESLVIPCR